MMETILSILCSQLLLLTILFFTTIQVTLRISKTGRDDHVESHIRAWFGLISIRTKVPLINLKKDLSGTEYQFELESPNEPLEKKKFKLSPHEYFQLLQRVQRLIKRVHQLHVIAKKFLKNIRLEELIWRSKIGTGHAAETGLLTGVGWGVKSNIIGMFSSYLTLRCVPRISVTPSFNEKKIESNIQCMIRFRIGNAIVAGIRILLNLRKRRDEKWQSTQFRA